MHVKFCMQCMNICKYKYLYILKYIYICIYHMCLYAYIYQHADSYK